MTYARIDHGKHGWALLALRIPGIRTLPLSGHVVAEMAACYSIAILKIETLNREHASASAIQEYDELKCSIEQEVEYYMAQHEKRVS